MLTSETIVVNARTASETVSFMFDHRRHGDPSDKDMTTTSPSTFLLEGSH
jgi:hypothetical protein